MAASVLTKTTPRSPITGRPAAVAAQPEPAALEQPGGLRTKPWDRALELLAAFVVGCCVMRFFYSDHPGVPEYDSYYHIKMALLLPKIGFIKQFPWLSQTIFADRFVSHHWGFQALLVPFVYGAKWLGSDPFIGAKWAMCCFFGTGLMLFTLLLQQEKVPLRWLWIILYLVGPEQYFDRHTFIRAINPSAACMLAIMILMFRGRYLLMGLAIALYTQIYLGSVVYSPVLVACYYAVGLLGPKSERLSWKLPVFGAAGWFLGFLLHPYRRGMFSFLKVQILASGLDPVIEVGTEWQAYDDVWWFAQHAGVPLILIGLALCLRLRLGPAANAKEVAALLISIAFFVLVLHQRRFIESWPLFSLVASAMLLRPVLTRFCEWARDPLEAPDAQGSAAPLIDGRLLSAIGMAAVCAVAVWVYVIRRPKVYELGAFERWYPMWIGAALLLMAAPLARIWLRKAPRTAFVRLAALESAGVLFGGAALLFVFATGAAPLYAGVRESTKRCFNLDELKPAMDYLQANSPEGSIVFTDDWDIFPALFYHNHHNRYIVGLDPVFSYVRDPEMYNRYMDISRGKTPRDYTADIPVDKPAASWLGRLFGLKKQVNDPRKLHVTLDDIADRFHCAYAITDRDHSRFRKKMEADAGRFERIYPAGPLMNLEDPEFAIYHVRPARIPTTAPASAPARRAPASVPSGADS